jgi:hypothetical protein
VIGDRFDARRAGGAIALARQAEDHPHGLRLEGVDLQGLLGLLPALFAGDDAVADRRQGAMLEALSRVLLHGPQGVLGILLGLILICVFCAITICPGSATACRRPDRVSVWPTAIRSPAAPTANSSPTTTIPLAIPTRGCSWASSPAPSCSADRPRWCLGSVPMAGFMVAGIYVVGMVAIWFGPETKGLPLED